MSTSVDSCVRSRPTILTWDGKGHPWVIWLIKIAEHFKEAVLENMTRLAGRLAPHEQDFDVRNGGWSKALRSWVANHHHYESMSASELILNTYNELTLSILYISWLKHSSSYSETIFRRWDQFTVFLRTSSCLSSWPLAYASVTAGELITPEKHTLFSYKILVPYNTWTSSKLDGLY